jgi:hypothetical protein
MKREQIINKIKEVTARLTAAEIEVCTCHDIYPKCWAESTHGSFRTPAMRPTELLAYVNGMAAALNKYVSTE